MPRKPTKRVTKRNDVALTFELHLFLSRGLDFFMDERPSEDERRRLWKVHRAEIMAQIGQKYPETDERHHLYVPYGCRPRAWWDFEAPEPRRMIVGDPSNALLEYGYFWGMPRCYMSDQADEYESQPAYLERLGLLMKDEKEKILPEAYEWH